MIELHIPQAGEETRNSKDLVFSILSKQQPLSTIEIVNIIRKQYNASLTYQAVKKAIDSLVVKNVLVKNGKKYSLDREWLTQLKMTVDNLLTKYEKDTKVHEFSTEIVGEQYAVYTLTNLLDLDNFWDDMLVYLSDNISDKEERIFFSRTHYSWWLLINLGREVKLFEHLSARKFKFFLMATGDYPLNEWAEKIYTGKFGTMKVVPQDVDDSISLNVIGDTVIQVKYPPEILSRLKKFYKRYRNTQEMSVKEITELANQQCEIKFNVFKSAEIANSILDKHKQFLNDKTTG